MATLLLVCAGFVSFFFWPDDIKEPVDAINQTVIAMKKYHLEGLSNECLFQKSLEVIVDNARTDAFEKQYYFLEGIGTDGTTNRLFFVQEGDESRLVLRQSIPGWLEGLYRYGYGAFPKKLYDIHTHPKMIGGKEIPEDTPSLTDLAIEYITTRTNVGGLNIETEFLVSDSLGVWRYHVPNDSAFAKSFEAVIWIRNLNINPKVISSLGIEAVRNVPFQYLASLVEQGILGNELQNEFRIHRADASAFLQISITIAHLEKEALQSNDILTIERYMRKRLQLFRDLGVEIERVPIDQGACN